jgi:transcriptional regulator with XRE-family HTH domain
MLQAEEILRWKAQGLSSKEIAKLCGVSEPTVSRVCSGEWLKARTRVKKVQEVYEPTEEEIERQASAIKAENLRRYREELGRKSRGGYHGK